jgi:hypothetical protein
VHAFGGSVPIVLERVLVGPHVNVCAAFMWARHVSALGVSQNVCFGHWHNVEFLAFGGPASSEMV